MKKNKVKYGLSNAHYAVEIVGEDGTITYDTPKAWPGSVSLTLSPTGSASSFYADNALYYTVPGAPGYEGELESALVPDDFCVDVLGDTLDQEKGILEAGIPTTKNFALLFQFEGDQKATRHCLYHCSASRPEVSGETVEESTTIGTETLSFTASARTDTGWVKYRTTPDTTDEVYSGWFKKVPIPKTEEV